MEDITNGVWYDARSGTFCTITDVGNEFTIHHYDTGDVYHRGAWDEFPENEFMRVSDECVKNPDKYMERKIDEWMESEDRKSDFDLCVYFAREQTKVVAKD